MSLFLLLLFLSASFSANGYLNGKLPRNPSKTKEGPNHKLLRDDSTGMTKKDNRGLMEINTAINYIPTRATRAPMTRTTTLGVLIVNTLLMLSNLHSESKYEMPNHLINYGHYCGPGPADPFNGVEPIDQVDRICQGHDQRYKMCLTEYQLPTVGTSQAVAIRGLLPWSRDFEKLFPLEFNQCIHRADVFFVSHLNQVKNANALPEWWDHPSHAPVGTEGVRGYDREACAVGIENVLCAISSKTMFSEVAINLFTADLRADERAGL